MEISTVKAQIQSGKLKPLYIFVGDDYYVRQQYIKKIAEKKDKNLIIVDDLQKALPKLNSRSMLNKSSVYVFYDCREFMDNEELVDRAMSGDFGDNIVILVNSTIDKRKKFYKNNVDNIVSFDGLDLSLLSKYVEKVSLVKITEYEIKDLIDAYNSNYGAILNELDKVNRYAEVKNIDSFRAVAVEMYDNMYLASYEEDTPFNFARAIFYKYADALDAYYAYKRGGGTTLAALGALYTLVRQVLQVKSCESGDVSASTGLTSWQIKTARQYCKVYSISRLIGIIRLIRECEVGIKTGKILDEIAIEYLLARIYGETKGI